MIQFTFIKWLTVFFLIAYIPRIFCWFAPLRKQKKYNNTKKNKFALIIPARNEGLAVMPLLESIKRQDYDNFDTYVVVKEHDDPVIEYAKMVDAAVLVDTAQKCKGDCLDYCIKEILRTKAGEYDGYMIVDADCVLDEKYLTEMNNAMESGADVINAKKLVKNYFTGNKNDTNLVTCCNGLIWTLMDDMGNRFKSDHGYTTMTITTGIMLSKRLVEDWKGWIYKKTLTEDMELQRDCGAKNIKTLYYSYAKIYMEESPSYIQTNKRRNRWMTGLTDADRLYCQKYRGKHSYYDLKNAYYIFCLWIVYAFIGTLTVMGTGNLFCALARALFTKSSYSIYLKVVVSCFMRIYLSFFVMTFVAMMTDRKNIKLPFFKKVLLLFAHPLFYMGYIKIVAKAILGKSNACWDEIERVEARA